MGAGCRGRNYRRRHRRWRDRIEPFPGYYGPGYYHPGYYESGYGGPCYWRRQRFWDGYGWRVRSIRVCE